MQSVDSRKHPYHHAAMLACLAACTGSSGLPIAELQTVAQRDAEGHGAVRRGGAAGGPTDAAGSVRASPTCHLPSMMKMGRLL